MTSASKWVGLLLTFISISACQNQTTGAPSQDNLPRVSFQRVRFDVEPRRGEDGAPHRRAGPPTIRERPAHDDD
jgi:hypothetical protein